MTFDAESAITNPTYDRSEARLYVRHKDILAGTHFHYLGDGVEAMDLTIAVETTEKATIAQRLPRITNKDGGITFAPTYDIMPGNPLYDALTAVGLLGKVNEEFELLFVYYFIAVKQNGTEVPDACFAAHSKGKFTVSTIGGAGTEIVKVTTEGKTDGDIDRGYVKVTDLMGDFDPDLDQWKTTAFTKVAGFGVGDLITRGA